MPCRPMRALQSGAPTRLSAQCQRASVGSRPFSQATRGPREEKSTTPTACLHSVHKGGENNDRGDGIPQSQVQQQRRHPIHHRTLPHPPPFSIRSGPRELLVLLLVCLPPPTAAIFSGLSPLLRLKIPHRCQLQSFCPRYRSWLCPTPFQLAWTASMDSGL
ncbi:hypothetical protein CPAR01_01299 [Colletotrichum paranaense]|uniref:Uncharacterized protein n=1 Tax=Colletotrichum paranaense TaxID=1914294 RepID=A0ABQ9T6C7_9PEZI|nr:uncharacterized protein CPAR01_01299 [Colletotrichum paranaense]KAK1547332.1 hypothetical protein CPAR01_01299 [Colletotrichum paranaense]